MDAQGHRVVGGDAPAVLKVLAHDLRWRLVSALAHSDLRVNELVRMAGEPTNLVSYHLRQLRDLGLVAEHRSEADGRDVYYTLDLPYLHSLYSAAGAALHPALLSTPKSFLEDTDALQPKLAWHRGFPSLWVLFLCTHNSARSQMAEAILRAVGGDQIQVASAGSEPTAIHPYAVKALAEMHIAIGDQHSKHVNDLQVHQFDYVITLCDHVREICPVFPGNPHQIHWSFPDPVAVPEADGKRLHAFQQTGIQLFTRIRYLLPAIAQEHGQVA